MKRHTIMTAALIAVTLAGELGSAALAQPTESWTYLCDVQHTSVAADPVNVPLALSWRYNTEETAEAISTPAVGSDRIYFAVGTKLYAVERSTGAPVWDIELNTQILSPLVLWGDTIYLGAADGKLWAVDAAAGAHKFKYVAGAPVRSAPLIHEGVLYFGADDKKIYAYDLATDRQLWQFQTGGAVQSTPAIWKDFVFFSSQDGNLYSLKRAEGRMVWYAQAARGRNQSFASPVVHRNQVLVAAGTQLIGFDAEKGTRRWSFTAGDLIAGGPAVQGRRAFIGSRDGVVYAVDTTRGKAVWRFPQRGPRGPVQSPPVLAGTVLLARGGGTVALMQPGAARTSVGQSYTVPTALWGLDPETGKLLWEYRLPQPEEPVTPVSGGYPEAMPGMMDEEMMEPGMMPPGGGFPPGGELQPGGMTPPRERATTAYTDPYLQFVDAAPAVSQGSVYLVGDDGVLYGFAAAATDNEQPLFDDAILSFPGPTPGTQYSFSITTEPSEVFFPPPPADDLIQLPGLPPLSVTAGVEDSGSGIDPDSVQVLVNDQQVPEDQVMYDAVEGKIWWVYSPRAAMARNYPAGRHIVEFRAADWYGNEAGSRVYFVVDNSLTAPKIPGVPQYPMGWPGEGMPPEGYPPGYPPPGGYMPPPY